MSFSQIENLWISNGGSPGWAPLMAGIAIAESGGNTTAWNQTAATGDDSVGLWQINYYGSLYPSRNAAYGPPAALAADPNAQAKAAINLSGNGANLSPWKTDKAWNAWQAAGAPATPNSTTVQSWLANAGVGGAAPGAGTTAATSSASVGGSGGSSTTAVLGIPDSAPPAPSIDDLNPIGSLASMIPWFGEFLLWSTVIMIIFILGGVLLVLGLVLLASVLAGPAIGPVTGVIGKASPSGRIIGAATSVGGRKTSAPRSTGRGSGGSRNPSSSRPTGGAANPGRAVSGAGRTTQRSKNLYTDAERADHRKMAADMREVNTGRRTKPRQVPNKPVRDTTQGGKYPAF